MDSGAFHNICQPFRVVEQCRLSPPEELIWLAEPSSLHPLLMTTEGSDWLRRRFVLTNVFRGRLRVQVAGWMHYYFTTIPSARPCPTPVRHRIYCVTVETKRPAFCFFRALYFSSNTLSLSRAQVLLASVLMRRTWNSLCIRFHNRNARTHRNYQQFDLNFVSVIHDSNSSNSSNNTITLIYEITTN